MSCNSTPVSIIKKVPRIIVIGDIHGDWLALKSSLKAAGITNHSNNWLGGSTHVVQVGDLLDRAVRGGQDDEKSESRIINHLLNLKKQARESGGDVHILLGNHELMNVMGDFRYVSPMGLKDFNGQRRQQFSPGGKMATLLACNTNSVIQIGSWIFSHAGVTEDITKAYTIEEVNDHVRNYFLGNRSDIRSPLTDMFWHRSYANESVSVCTSVSNALRHWKAKNMAIGHTIQNNIGSICNSLWKVDVGMSGAFSNKCYVEVLEILDDGKEVNIIRGKRPCRKI